MAIRENLCDLPRASLKEMVEEINGEQPTLFRWVMHWPAALYQRPGYHIGTALWFVGRRGGVGKGTLLQILSQLLGDCYIGKLDADEMCRGWTTSRRSAQTPQLRALVSTASRYSPTTSPLPSAGHQREFWHIVTGIVFLFPP